MAELHVSLRQLDFITRSIAVPPIVSVQPWETASETLRHRHCKRVCHCNPGEACQVRRGQLLAPQPCACTA